MALKSDRVDLLLNKTTHDVVLVGGDWDWSKDSDAVAQAIKIAVSMHKGEWFLDIEEGVAYFERPGVTADQAILGSKFDAAKVQAEYVRVIRGVAGVKELISVRADFNSKTRTLSVSWTVTTEYDDTITDSLKFTR